MRTIDGNARRLIVRSEGNLGFCPQLGRMVYEGGRWKVDELNRGVHWMSEMTFEMLDEGDVLINEGALTNNRSWSRQARRRSRGRCGARIRFLMTASGGLRSCPRSLLIVSTPTRTFSIAKMAPRPPYSGTTAP